MTDFNPIDEELAPSKAHGGTDDDDPPTHADRIVESIKNPDVFENETIVDESAQRVRYRVTAAMEFDVTPEEGTGFWDDPENESDQYEALTMAHAMGVDELIDVANTELRFAVEKFNAEDNVWEVVYDHGNP